MIKAVVDTNILVSGFISPFSYPKEIEKRWRKGEFILVTSREIIEEVSRVLYLPRIKVKYRITESDIQAFILTLLNKSEYIVGRLTLKNVAPDPGDDKIISCAVEGYADFIVTGDKDLLQLRKYQDIKIINAEAFVRVLGVFIERAAIYLM